MKTAKEILLDTIPKDCYWEEMENLTNTPIRYIIEAMEKFSNQVDKPVSDDLVRKIEEDFIYAINGIAKEPKEHPASYYNNYLRAFFEQGQAMKLPLELILKNCCIELSKIINDNQTEKIKQALNSR